MNEPQCNTCSACSDDELLGHIAELVESKSSEDSLIQLLHLAQGIYGYLPLEVQKIIADKTGIPLAGISGVVSFYSFFSTQPRGQHTIRVCLGTACYVRGGKQILERFQKLLQIQVGQTTNDRLFTLEVARCIGACGLAPAISVDDLVYRQVKPDKLEQILDLYRKEQTHAG